jgi:pyruvate, water dikinase
MSWIKWFDEIGMEDLAQVGGKNASLGELRRNLGEAGVAVPDGFAVTASAYEAFLADNDLVEPIGVLLGGLDPNQVDELRDRAAAIRKLIVDATFSPSMIGELRDAYAKLCADVGTDAAPVAVRSSATAEDLPTASFAGQLETFLMVTGDEDLVDRVRDAFASLFTARAISYREDLGFDHLATAVSVGVQHMVRSDLASSGVIFTLDPDSGHRDFVVVTSSWGLGENVVQGNVGPDEFLVHKPTLLDGFRPIVRKAVGSKELWMRLDDHGRVVNQATPEDRQSMMSLIDDEVLRLAEWSIAIEEHYSKIHGRPTPMDIEWAKDGVGGELYVVQARPETVYSHATGPLFRRDRLEESGEILTTGIAVGNRIASGPARIVDDPARMESFADGEVLVTKATDPDWEPLMSRASAIVTEHGGRTSHAAIVSRELGVPAVVGTGDARTAIDDGAEVTVSCAESATGVVYRGALEFSSAEIDPSELPKPKAKIMLNAGDPARALTLSRLPVDGVGLARMEFILAGSIGVHPLALTRYEQLSPEAKLLVDEATAGYRERTEFFVDRLAQGIGTIAAAFFPRPVILRLSDFKSNEYGSLVGGAAFEPDEENPMIGWRGASRYYHEDYRDGFELELAAVRRVRDDFGLRNLKVMVPFCRTVAEADRVLEVMAENGLVRGEDGLEVYVMAELPSNVLDADRFAQRFDGFSIGSNDLTQLVLGVDRDSTLVAPLFDERDQAVRTACVLLLEAAARNARPVGICGQAPSDYPEFAAFLVDRGIDSLSLSADAVMETMELVVAIERNRPRPM